MNEHFISAAWPITQTDTQTHRQTEQTRVYIEFMSLYCLLQRLRNAASTIRHANQIKFDAIL